MKQNLVEHYFKDTGHDGIGTEKVDARRRDDRDVRKLLERRTGSRQCLPVSVV